MISGVIISPNQFLVSIAKVLAPVKEQVVVIGAVALNVHLLSASRSGLVTRDVDLVVNPRDSDEIIGYLKDRQFQASNEPGERGYTWIKGDLKIQLIVPARRLGGGASDQTRLPVQPRTTIASTYYYGVSFAAKPKVIKFNVASPAALVVLKFTALGRNDYDGNLVERDYADIIRLFDACDDSIASESIARSAEFGFVKKAAELFASDKKVQLIAARQLAAEGQVVDSGAGIRFVVRQAQNILTKIAR